VSTKWALFLASMWIVGSPGRAGADVITGSVQDWLESGPDLIVGDGIHHVTMWWSGQSNDHGFFYGSNFTGDSDVAIATGVTDVSQIVNAGAYFFQSRSVGPVFDADADPLAYGQFVIYRHDVTHHYAVLHVQDIHGPVFGWLLDATWWFQTDGSGNFGSQTMRRADANRDGNTDIGDAISILGHLFSGGAPFSCEDAADVNDDGEIDIGDAIYLLVNLFGNGPPIPSPSTGCDVDPTNGDSLDCVEFPSCP